MGNSSSVTLTPRVAVDEVIRTDVQIDSETGTSAEDTPTIPRRPCDTLDIATTALSGVCATTASAPSTIAATTTIPALSISTIIVYSSWWLYHRLSAIHALFTTPEYDNTNVTDAIAKLQSTLTFLDTKMVTMTDRVNKYTNEAMRLYGLKNRTGAMHQLRLKKMYEQEIAKMDSLKFNLESNILHMESVGVMMETVSTIKETSHQFQVVSKHVDFTKLEDTIEEMFEQRDTSKDIETILHGMHDAHEYDEEELLAELKTMVGDAEEVVDVGECETGDARVQGTAVVASLPHPPQPTVQPLLELPHLPQFPSPPTTIPMPMYTEAVTT